MINPKTFVESIDNTFWKYIIDDALITDIVGLKDINKEKELYSLVRKINAGDYKPLACKVIGFPKTRGILRPVFHLFLNDSVVYYYCIKELQDYFVNQITTVPYAFGGFRLTEKLNMTEEKLEELAYDPGYESFVKSNYRKEWSDYQNLAETLYRGNYDYYMHLDIAHFYDSIPLHALESEVRKCPEKKEVVDLLFYFLRNIRSINKTDYTENRIGVPQEEVGEMSRLLANYYLHSFDVQFLDQIKTLFEQDRGINYQYTRFADDLWIAFRGSEDLSYKITQIVSQLLSDLGLHLNEAKTKILASEEFNKYWCFDEWQIIQDDEKTPIFIYDYLKSLYENKDDSTRWFTPFHYGLKKVINTKKILDILNEEQISWIIEIILKNPNFISRNNKPFEVFIGNTILKYPAQKKKLITFFTTEKSCYPVVVFSLLTVLLKMKNDNDVLELMDKVFFQPQWRDLFWFNKCIALRYFSENALYIKDNKRNLLDKILSHIDTISESFHGIERRYAIKYLVSLPNMLGADIISRKFSLPEDTYLVEYIKRN